MKNMESGVEDCKSLLVQLKHQNTQLRLKRRWLMGLTVSKHEHRQLNKFQNDRIMPESFLREDDVYYETIKTFVEKGVGKGSAEREHRVVDDNRKLTDLPNNIGDISSLVDDMTNKGLCHFAEILTRGSVKFEKTRWQMKKIIKECLPEVLQNRNDNHHMNMCRKLYSLLKDPHNFRGSRAALLTTASHSYHAATIKVLDGLEDLPTRTLGAMHRKLRGIQGYIPILQAPKSGWGRDILIGCLRKCCLEMLSKHGEGDELPEPLVKAMAVAGLTLKLILGCHYVPEFKQFSSETEVLQNDIAKAIWLLNKKVRFPELKNLQLLLDPNAKLSNRGLRIAIRNLLTEYLFECSDMDTIPECLLEALDIINKSSRSVPYRYFSEKEIEEEVECTLNVSAQTKQIVWDLIPEHDFDQDFADAYIEDLAESDDGKIPDDYELQGELPQDSRFYCSDTNDQIESIGETNLTNLKSPSPTTKGDGCSPAHTPNRSLYSKEYLHITEMDSVNSYGSASPSSCFESKILDSPLNMAEHTKDSAKPPEFVCGERNSMHSTSRNRYVAIQEASDETSMVAYCVIGHMLEKFAQIEGLKLDQDDVSYLRGYDPIQKNSKVVKEEQTSCEEDACDSVIFQVLEELIPSFPKSGKKRLKKLMGLG